MSRHRRCESTLRGRRSARSSLIGRNRKIRPISAFTERSRAPGTPARAFDLSVTRH